jgi:hypothetical protein
VSAKSSFNRVQRVGRKRFNKNQLESTEFHKLQQPLSPGRVGQALGWVEFSGAALFTFFVKGACFLFLIDVQFDLCEKSF